MSILLELDMIGALNNYTIKTELGKMPLWEIASKHWWLVKKGLKNNQFDELSTKYFKIYDKLRESQLPNKI